MIVQNNPNGTERFVMTMEQHAAFAGRLSNIFGNDCFSSINHPAILYVIAHHDAGWQSVDACVHLDPETGLPYHLSDTPFEFSSKTMQASPNFNEQHHPLAGLISSMHTAGLLNGRYGLAPPGILSGLKGERKAHAESLLRGELARQAALQPLCGIDEKGVWRAYRQLQFFDMLSLYFHSTAENYRGNTRIPEVPTIGDERVEIRIMEQNAGVYAVHPFPFNKSGIKVSFEGRWMSPVFSGESGPATLQSRSIARQTVSLVRT